MTSACATIALWEATDPGEYIAVPQNEISESELVESGVDFRRDDEEGVYYVEKSSARRLGDYTVRFFAIPVTVALDAATAIVVVGVLVYGNNKLDELDRKSGGRGRGCGTFRHTCFDGSSIHRRHPMSDRLAEKIASMAHQVLRWPDHRHH